jgi:hypothetical protein
METTVRKSFRFFFFLFALKALNNSSERSFWLLTQIAPCIFFDYYLHNNTEYNHCKGLERKNIKHFVNSFIKLSKNIQFMHIKFGMDTKLKKYFTVA